MSGKSAYTIFILSLIVLEPITLGFLPRNGIEEVFEFVDVLAYFGDVPLEGFLMKLLFNQISKSNSGKIEVVNPKALVVNQYFDEVYIFNYHFHCASIHGLQCTETAGIKSDC